MKPTGTTTLFRGDVVVVTAADPIDMDIVLQYKIEDYRGALDVPADWQGTRLDGGQWCFSLPAGSMRVRVRSAPGAGSTALASEASAALAFLVKGAWTLRLLFFCSMQKQKPCFIVVFYTGT